MQGQVTRRVQPPRAAFALGVACRALAGAVGRWGLRGASALTWCLLSTLAAAQGWGLRVTPAPAGEGAQVASVEPGSAAQLAGLRVGDRVLAAGSLPIRAQRDLDAALRGLAPGAPLQLRIARAGWERTVLLAARPERETGWLGAAVEEIVADGGASRVVRLSALAGGGPAARAGLAVGDLIVEVDGRPPEGVAGFERSVAGMRAGARLRLTIERDGWQRQVAVVLERSPSDPGRGAAGPVGAPAGAGPQIPAQNPAQAFQGAPAPAAAISPQELNALAEAADRAYVQQDWPAAAAAYRTYVERAPNEARAWERLGHALVMTGRHAEAVDACSRSIEIGPPSAGAWNNIGLSLARLGKPDAARSAYQRAVELAPDLMPARLGLANALIARSDWAGAREHLQVVVAATPQDMGATLALAGVLTALGRPAEAAVQYRRVVDAGAGGPDVDYALALALYRSDRAADALPVLQRMLEANPRDARSLLLLGHVQDRLGDAASARRAWDRAAAIEPSTARTGPPMVAAEAPSVPMSPDPSTAAAREASGTAPSSTAGAPGPAGASASASVPAAVGARRPDAAALSGAVPRPTSAAADKASVSVGDFQVKASGASQMIGDGLREMLVTALHNSGRYVVLERMDLPGLAAEQQFSRSRLARQGAALPDRQMEVAEITVYGAVTEFLSDARGSGFEIGLPKLPFSVGRQSSKAHLALDVRVVDVASGRILAAQRIEGEADAAQMSLGGVASAHGTQIPMGLSTYRNTPMEQAIRTCVEKAVAYITQAVPPDYFRHR